jgi:hypothetical protein
MPKDVDSMLKSWDEIKDCEFYAINGQYIAVAARRMIEDLLCIRNDEVQYWDAFIVWSKDSQDLKAISNYYNLINKVNPLKATWENNVIHVLETWVSMGRPKQVRNNSKGLLSESVK